MVGNRTELANAATVYMPTVRCELYPTTDNTLHLNSLLWPSAKLRVPRHANKQDMDKEEIDLQESKSHAPTAHRNTRETSNSSI